MKKFIIYSFIMAFVCVLLLNSSANAQTLSFNNNLSVGSGGLEVVSLQTWLIANGYDIPAITSGLANKGFFGSQTKAAVQKFQYDNQIPNTGFVGRLTRGRINKILGDSDQRGASLTVVYPNGGETLQRDSSVNILWKGATGILSNSRADIWLTPQVPACAEDSAPVRCMIAVHAPYKIVGNIDLTSGNYLWDKVGTTYNEIGSGEFTQVPDGQYKIKICPINSSAQCDSSEGYFTIITSGTVTNKPPVIDGVDAPTTLSIGQTGTWIIHASDPENGILSYSVDWGDVQNCVTQGLCSTNGVMALPAYVQASTFTHSYSRSGTFTVTILVTDDKGYVARTSTTVQVGISTAGSLKIISPNGGEIWKIGSTQTIRWTSPYYFRATYANLNLVPYVPPCTIEICPGNSPYYGPLTIAKNISMNQNSYNWIVGQVISDEASSTVSYIHPAQYKMILCEVDSNVCVYSDKEFTISN